MTEYEIADYATSVMSNFLSAITIYFSVVTAYVVAAYTTGERLSKLQLSIVNITFTIASGIMGLLSFLLCSRFYELVNQSGHIRGDTPIVDFSIPLGILVSIVFLGSIIFMWSVRRKSNGS